MATLVSFQSSRSASTEEQASDPPVLSPWPTTAVALAAAREAVWKALGQWMGASGGIPAEEDLPMIDRYAVPAAELVERYGPRAPQAVKNEAVLRTVGYLAGSPPSTMTARNEGATEGQGKSFSYTPARQSALRHSGAMALLSPWKVRRGGIIG